jgi:hypothetical protein
MPRVRRQSRRNRTEYTDEHVRVLLRGYDFWELFGDRNDPQSLERIQHAWEQLANVVLPQHIADRPGSRPWAWWRWDAPGPRRFVVDMKDWEPVGKPTWYGRWTLFQPTTDTATIDTLLRCEDLYETEFNYLRRHRLLTPEEQEALRQAKSPA